MRTKLLLFTLLIPLTLWAAGEFLFIGSGSPGIGGNTITLSVVDTGDTAKVIRVSQFTGRDSFDYIDSIAVVTSADGADSSESIVKFTSPLQVSRITLGSEFAGRFDTTLILACSLDMGTNRYGFKYTVNNGVTDTLFAIVIDSLVARWNAESGMSDTTLAEDSVTYIKIISKFAMDSFLESAARWTLYLGDSLTEGQRDSCDIKMVVDSMVDKINADSIGGYVTAANLTDTAYTVTSDLKGRIFSIFFADTAQDTTIQVANKKSVSTKTDTIGLGVTVGFKTLSGRIIIRPGRSIVSGFGSSDTASIWLETYSETGLINVLDSVHAGQIPCTVDVIISRARGDTLLYPYLRIRAYVEDSTTDTTMTVVYPIWFDLTLK